MPDAVDRPAPVSTTTRPAPPQAAASSSTADIARPLPYGDAAWYRNRHMAVRVGVGLTNFPFSGPRAFWRFVERCEAGNVDSLWQSDRLVSPYPQLEAMSVMAAPPRAPARRKFGMRVVAVT